MKHETTVHTIHCGTIFYATCSCHWQSEDTTNSYLAERDASRHKVAMSLEEVIEAIDGSGIPTIL